MPKDDMSEMHREMFPVLNDCVYLDTGTCGISAPVHEKAAAAFYAEGKSKGAIGRDIWQNKAAEVRTKLADWMSVSASEIDFFSGTTDALNIIGHSIQWRASDEIVMADDEFPSVQVAWQAAEKAGATIRRISISSEAERQRQLADALTPRTRMLVVSHVHSMAGTRLDLDALGRLCRANGTLFVVDGIHAFGAVPPTLDQVDIYMAGVFKWMLAGFGLSVCVVREAVRSELAPAFRGYLNQPPEQGLQFAHINYPGVYVLDATLDLFGKTIGWENVHRRTASLVQWLADDLAEGGIEVATPEGARAGIASFPLPDPERTLARLNADRMYAAARGPYLRASPFFYNSRDDIRQFAEAVLRYR